MPDTLDVSQTRGNLLDLRDQLAQLEAGHDLLDRKRRVLMQELLDMLADAEHVATEARERFDAAYEAIVEARMDMGVDRLQWLSLASSAEIAVNVETRSIMGVMAALVDVQIETLPIPYGPGHTSVSLDRAHARWLEVGRVLGRLAEKTVTVWRLATELRKTQRRVNALEEIMIPRHEAAIDEITAALDEKERGEIVDAKKVAERLAGPGAREQRIEDRD